MFDIADAFYRGLKVSAIVAISAAFLLGINALIGLLGAWVNSTVIGEFFGMVSMYLPFNAGTVFNSILLVCSGIFTFKVAMKIFNLASWGVSSA